MLGEADDVRAFLTLIDVASFHGEARFRLAELAALICAYEPAALDHVAYSVDAPREDMSRSIWELLTTAEYRSVVASSGKIGYVRRPMLAIAELTRRARALANGDRAKAFLAIAKTSADVAGVSSWSDRAQALVRGIADVVVPGEYRPPMISLGQANRGVYAVALREAFPDARPSDGLIMHFEQMRAGQKTTIWLNKGEEHKLHLEAAGSLARRRQELESARVVQAYLFGSP